MSEQNDCLLIKLPVYQFCSKLVDIITLQPDIQAVLLINGHSLRARIDLVTGMILYQSTLYERCAFIPRASLASPAQGINIPSGRLFPAIKCPAPNVSEHTRWWWPVAPPRPRMEELILWSEKYLSLQHRASLERIHGRDWFEEAERCSWFCV